MHAVFISDTKLTYKTPPDGEKSLTMNIVRHSP